MLEGNIVVGLFWLVGGGISLNKIILYRKRQSIYFFFYKNALILLKKRIYEIYFLR